MIRIIWIICDSLLSLKPPGVRRAACWELLRPWEDRTRLLDAVALARIRAALAFRSAITGIL